MADFDADYILIFARTQLMTFKYGISNLIIGDVSAILNVRQRMFVVTQAINEHWWSQWLVDLKNKLESFLIRLLLMNVMYLMKKVAQVC